MLIADTFEAWDLLVLLFCFRLRNCLSLRIFAVLCAGCLVSRPRGGFRVSGSPPPVVRLSLAIARRLWMILVRLCA